MQSMEPERAQEEDDETHQIRSLGRSGQRQLPQQGSLDVSLHSGAFTSPADYFLRIIKFECREGIAHAACSEILSGTGTSFTHCGLCEWVCWFHWLQSCWFSCLECLNGYDLSPWRHLHSFVHSFVLLFSQDVFLYSWWVSGNLATDPLQFLSSRGGVSFPWLSTGFGLTWTGTGRDIWRDIPAPHCPCCLHHVWGQTPGQRQLTPCGEKWTQLSPIPNANPEGL